jgi:hypothetical protein
MMRRELATRANKTRRLRYVELIEHNTVSDHGSRESACTISSHPYFLLDKMTIIGRSAIDPSYRQSHKAKACPWSLVTGTSVPIVLETV